MRAEQALLKRIGEKRGETPALWARVHPREDANLAVGMDVRTWVKEGIIDGLVVNYAGPQFDQDFDHEWIVEDAQAAGVLVFSHLGRTPYDDRDHEPSIEMYRAAASNHHNAKVDALYLSSLGWPHRSQEYGVLRELGDPDIYARKNKHYITTQNDPEDPFGAPRHVPAVLDEGVTACIPIYVGDDAESARADNELERVTLGVRIVQTGLEDKLRFAFNGMALTVEPRNIKTYYGGLVAYGVARAGFPPHKYPLLV